MRFFSVTAALCGLAMSGLALSGCTDSDWDHAMTYSGLGEQMAAADPPVAPPVTAPAPASNASFCESVAKQAATSDGFDAATQQRMFQRSFQQCVAMFGTATAAR
jgi:hypothetical protein